MLSTNWWVHNWFSFEEITIFLWKNQPISQIFLLFISTGMNYFFFQFLIEVCDHHFIIRKLFLYIMFLYSATLRNSVVRGKFRKTLSSIREVLATIFNHCIVTHFLQQVLVEVWKQTSLYTLRFNNVSTLSICVTRIDWNSSMSSIMARNIGNFFDFSENDPLCQIISTWVYLLLMLTVFTKQIFFHYPFIGADYVDRVDTPRGFPGTFPEVPPANKVSQALFNVEHTNKGNGHLTVMFMTFGQFLDHDLALSTHPECHDKT